jgi:hypothetical protein
LRRPSNPQMGTVIGKGESGCLLHSVVAFLDTQTDIFAVRLDSPLAVSYLVAATDNGYGDFRAPVLRILGPTPHTCLFSPTMGVQVGSSPRSTKNDVYIAGEGKRGSQTPSLAVLEGRYASTLGGRIRSHGYGGTNQVSRRGRQLSEESTRCYRTMALVSPRCHCFGCKLTGPSPLSLHLCDGNPVIPSETLRQDGTQQIPQVQHDLQYLGITRWNE